MKLMAAIALALIGTMPHALHAQKATLHPTGLLSLHENIPGIQKIAASSYAAAAAAAPLPTSADLSVFFPAPGNQGSMGSCVAFATGYALESYEQCLNRSWTPAGAHHIWSPAYIFSLGHVGQNDDGGGMFLSDAFTILSSQGCATLDDMPYDGSLFAWKVQPTAAQRADAANYKVSGWGIVPAYNPDAIKVELASGSPVVIAILVYPDFDNLSPSNPIYDDYTGLWRGQHAVCLVGYDDAKQAFKLINSWGAEWGINGYGWISYDVIRNNYIDAYVVNGAIDYSGAPVFATNAGGGAYAGSNGVAYAADKNFSGGSSATTPA